MRFGIDLRARSTYNTGHDSVDTFGVHRVSKKTSLYLQTKGIMNRTSKAIIWSLLFVVLLLACDQFMLRVEFTQPQMQVARSFYLDFRHRLIALSGDPEPESVEVVIEETRPDTTPKAYMGSNEEPPRYFYVDADGTIQFVDSLEAIPRELRNSAKRLAD